MSDCPNAEIRDLLPDLLHDRLDAPTRARVLAHVDGCADCRSELELLRSLRGSLERRRRAAEAVDGPSSSTSCVERLAHCGGGDVSRRGRHVAHCRAKRPRRRRWVAGQRIDARSAADERNDRHCSSGGDGQSAFDAAR